MNSCRPDETAFGPGTMARADAVHRAAVRVRDRSYTGLSGVKPALKMTIPDFH
jgi:hypothetical protein